VDEAAHPRLCALAVVDQLRFYGFEGRDGEEGLGGAGAEAGEDVGGCGDGACYWVGEEGFVGVEGYEACRAGLANIHSRGMAKCL
jgi:hypothetical protein